MENSQRTVTKKKAAGCQDEGYQKFFFLRIVFIGTFRANIVGKIQTFNQGSITEKKDDYWNKNDQYEICDQIYFKFGAPRSSAKFFFVIVYVKEKSWKTYYYAYNPNKNNCFLDTVLV